MKKYGSLDPTTNPGMEIHIHFYPSYSDGFPEPMKSSSLLVS